MNELTQYGVPGIIALMILKEVFSFMKNKRNGYNPNNQSKAIERMAIGIAELTSAVKADRQLATERHRTVIDAIRNSRNV